MIRLLKRNDNKKPAIIILNKEILEWFHTRRGTRQDPVLPE